MPIRSVVAVVVAAMCVTVACGQPYTEPILVNIPGVGSVEGLTVYRTAGQASHNQFFGIPFGEDTSGPNRWMPPVPKAPWQATLNATQFRSACPQGDKLFLNLSFSEDCLFLNIWTPVQQNNPVPGPYPVLVFIHGGGYMDGTGADPVFAGDYFANSTQQPLIVVTLNYRLGALGFLNTAELDGNYGTRDQQLALKWVYTNIEAFGGDTSNITIEGQSAGGMSIATHLYIESSWPYYTAAVLDSNPAGLLYRTPDQNQMFSNELAKLLLCAVSDTACLRSRTWQEIIAVQMLDYIHPYSGGLNTWEFLIWAPVIDGTFFTEAPWTALANGNYNRNVPVLMGSMRNDSYGFIDFLKPVWGNLEYEVLLKALFKNSSAAVYAQYPPTPGMDAFSQFTMMATDYLFTCPTRHMAYLMSSQQSPPVYLWEFMHVPSVFPELKDPACTSIAVCHSAELAFVFNSASQFAGKKFTDAEFALSKYIQQTWATFASGQMYDLPMPWTPYQSGHDSSVWLDVGGQSAAGVNGYHGTNCDFWDNLGYIF